MSEEEIEEIRQIRHAISAEGEHDVHRVVGYYKAIEKELRQSGEFRFEEARTSLQEQALAPTEDQAGQV